MHQVVVHVLQQVQHCMLHRRGSTAKAWLLAPRNCVPVLAHHAAACTWAVSTVDIAITGCSMAIDGYRFVIWVSLIVSSVVGAGR